jgi:hypothetical protein
MRGVETGQELFTAMENLHAWTGEINPENSSKPVVTGPSLCDPNRQRDNRPK